MRSFLLLIALLAVFWAAAFAHFIAAMPRTPAGDSVATDAIVVLTGDSGRIAYGFSLLEQGRARRLFITGVGEQASLEQLLQAHGASGTLQAMVDAGEVRIALDHRADSTRGNALQTAQWMQTEHLDSLRLVTSNYHLPRSLIEFRHAMPHAEIVPDPVFAAAFAKAGWWQDADSRLLVLSEFHKYLVAWLYLRFSN